MKYFIVAGFILNKLKKISSKSDLK